jgi:hypothetical protein
MMAMSSGCLRQLAGSDGLAPFAFFAKEGRGYTPFPNTVALTVALSSLIAARLQTRFAAFGSNLRQLSVHPE